MHHALPGEGDQFHLALITRFEACGIACGDVQTEAARSGTIKAQSRVGLEEMVVTADLNGTVAGVGHAEHFGFQAHIGLNEFIGAGWKDFAWDHA